MRKLRLRLKSCPESWAENDCVFSIGMIQSACLVPCQVHCGDRLKSATFLKSFWNSRVKACLRQDSGHQSHTRYLVPMERLHSRALSFSCLLSSHFVMLLTRRLRIRVNSNTYSRAVSSFSLLSDLYCVSSRCQTNYILGLALEPNTHSSMYLPILPSIHPSIHPSTHLSIHPPTQSYIALSIHQILPEYLILQ